MDPNDPSQYMLLDTALWSYICFLASSVSQDIYRVLTNVTKVVQFLGFFSRFFSAKSYGSDIELKGWRASRVRSDKLSSIQIADLLCFNVKKDYFIFCKKLHVHILL